MDKGPMGRIHQPHDRVIDVGVEVLPVDDLRPPADQAGKRRRRPIGFAAARLGRHPDEHQALALGDRIARRADAGEIEILPLRQRRDRRALAVGGEAPAVIGTFDAGVTVGLAREPRIAFTI